MIFLKNLRIIFQKKSLTFTFSCAIINTLSIRQAQVAELADAQDLKSCGKRFPCRFDPGLGHHHGAKLSLLRFVLQKKHLSASLLYLFGYALWAHTHPIFLLNHRAISKELRLMLHRIRVCQCPDYTAGISGGKAMRRNRTGHNAACTDHAALADCHARQNRHIRTDPAAVSDPYRLCVA